MESAVHPFIYLQAFHEYKGVAIQIFCKLTPHDSSDTNRAYITDGDLDTIGQSENKF